MIKSRLVVAALAASLLAPVAAFAQAGSTTAPSNSEGTPQSSTGVVGTSRVAPPAASTTPKRTTHRRTTTRHHSTTAQ